MSFRYKFSIKIILISLILTCISLSTAASVFRCVKCTADCTHHDYPLTACPADVVGCVTVRLTRDMVIRDCYTEKYQRMCSPYQLANRTCSYCDDSHGCNMKQQDPLICRSCDWTMDGVCNNTVVCRTPFQTETPLCYILFRKSLGFHFGCFDEVTSAIEYLMAEDKYRITFDLCDSNECNAHPKYFWRDWEKLLDPFRLCEVCNRERQLEHCGVKACSMDDIYSMFCIRIYSYASGARSESHCLSEFPRSRLNYLINEKGKEFVCNSDRCNSRTAPIRDFMYECKIEGLYAYQNAYRLQDRCVSYILPNGTNLVLGRLSNNRCTDPKRCRTCDSDHCNEAAAGQDAANYCFKVAGERALYIRREQTGFMALCEAGGCSTSIDSSGLVSRGCAADKNADSIVCKGFLCNRQIAGITCFTCQPTDPNCVFSQHEGPFETCPPQYKGCYTKILGDSSVERGCALERTPNTTINDGSVYIFCDESNVCNRHSTIKHSCHCYQLNVDLKPNRTMKRGLWRIQTRQGWLFETCPDIDGLPACYVHTSYMRINFGCVKDLNNYQLVNYHRGDLIDSLNLCDGHYCNYLPDV